MAGDLGAAGSGRSAAVSVTNHSPMVSLTGTAACLEHGVQYLETRDDRDRQHEVSTGELHLSLDAADPYIVLHHRVSAAKAMLVAQPLEDTLGRMLLLRWRQPVR